MNGTVYFKKSIPSLQVMAKELTEDNLEEAASEIRGGRVENGVLKYTTAMGPRYANVGQILVEFHGDNFTADKDWFESKYEVSKSIDLSEQASDPDQTELSFDEDDEEVEKNEH